MLKSGNSGSLVTSTKLLRRLEKKGLICEPDENERPQLPSRRSWGGKRGYYYVIPVGETKSFRFEGSNYYYLIYDKRTYIYGHKDIHN